MLNRLNPLLLVDSYKLWHKQMYVDGMKMLYSNGTCRKSRMKGVDHVIWFGLQAFIMEYLRHSFDNNFFARNEVIVMEEYDRHYPIHDNKHIKALHRLNYLPLEIKALPEGTRVPIGVPMFTITNTHPDFGWLVNYVETLMSMCLWQTFTSATIAYEYKKILNAAAFQTVGEASFVQWQGHDFSARGMSSPESSIFSGMGHLTSFTGSDTIAASYGAEQYYGASGLIGASVPATEHSVMCMGTKEGELDTFKRLLNLHKTGILSVVSDTWDLWHVLTNLLPALKKEILARDGKLVIRPDSGDPVKIITGWLEDEVMISDDEDVISGIAYEPVMTNENRLGWKHGRVISKPEQKGVVELLWDTFGGTINEYGYKVLDSHVGAIYGDSITLDRAQAICERLEAKGFASTNVVFGIGSYTYQFNTRDTFGFAIKATYGEVLHGDPSKGDSHGYLEQREIFKDPITDDGTKKSKKGLLMVYQEDGVLKVKDQCTKEEEATGLLETVFKDGVIKKRTTFQEIRDRIEASLPKYDKQLTAH